MLPVNAKKLKLARKVGSVGRMLKFFQSGLGRAHWNVDASLRNGGKPGKFGQRSCRQRGGQGPKPWGRDIPKVSGHQEACGTERVVGGEVREITSGYRWYRVCGPSIGMPSLRMMWKASGDTCGGMNVDQCVGWCETWWDSKCTYLKVPPRRLTDVLNGESVFDFD